MSSSIEKSVPESCMPVLDGLEVSSLVDAIGPIESCVYQIGLAHGVASEKDISSIGT